MEATPGFEPGDHGFANQCLTAWLCRRVVTNFALRNFRRRAAPFAENCVSLRCSSFPMPTRAMRWARHRWRRESLGDGGNANASAALRFKCRGARGISYAIGAGEGARTLYLHLGKVALYQMSYARASE